MTTPTEIRKFAKGRAYGMNDAANQLDTLADEWQSDPRVLRDMRNLASYLREQAMAILSAAPNPILDMERRS